MRDGSLVGQVSSALREAGLEPEGLELEVTERALAEEPGEVAQALRALRGLGVRLALDDFGTGYSSLASLRELDVDALKLDRSFVRGLGENARAIALAEGIAALAGRLGDRAPGNQWRGRVLRPQRRVPLRPADSAPGRQEPAAAAVLLT